MIKVNIPIISWDGHGYDCITIQIDTFVQKICDKMADMKMNGYEPKYLVMWDGYSSVVNQINNNSYMYDPLAPKSRIQRVLGLEVITTQKVEVLEVF